MNSVLILFYLFLSFQFLCAQNCDFGIRNLSDELNGEVILIEESVFEKVDKLAEKPCKIKSRTESELTKSFPEIFKLIDSCYYFSKGDSNQSKNSELKACKNKTESKQYSEYEFIGVYCNNGLIKITGFESWGFLSVDLDSGNAFYTMGKPITSNGETAISYSNNYGEEEIALTELETGKQFVIGIEGWRTMESKTLKNTYYLKLEPEFLTDCLKELKYIKVGIKN